MATDVMKARSLKGADTAPKNLSSIEENLISKNFGSEKLSSFSSSMVLEDSSLLS